MCQRISPHSMNCVFHFKFGDIFTKQNSALISSLWSKTTKYICDMMWHWHPPSRVQLTLVACTMRVLILLFSTFEYLPTPFPFGCSSSRTASVMVKNWFQLGVFWYFYDLITVCCSWLLCLFLFCSALADDYFVSL